MGVGDPMSASQLAHRAAEELPRLVYQRQEVPGGEGIENASQGPPVRLEQEEFGPEAFRLVAIVVILVRVVSGAGMRHHGAGERALTLKAGGQLELPKRHRGGGEEGTSGSEAQTLKSAS